MTVACRACSFTLASCAFVVASAALFPGGAIAQNWQSIPVNPNVTIAYVPPSAAQLQDIYQKLKNRQVLEEYQHFLAPLRLPHPLRLEMRQCNAANSFYGERTLTICYELVSSIEQQAPQTVSKDGFITREGAIAGGVVGVMLHESGHMMFDMFDVPVFGREEDAADETASFLALQFNKNVALTVTKGFAYEWAVGKDPSASDPMSVFSDEHGTASQRMYNTLCLAYGGDPQTFADFVAKGYLPKQRADACAQDYAQVKFAFETAVFPFIDSDLMARVKNTEWFTPEELK